MSILTSVSDLLIDQIWCGSQNEAGRIFSFVKPLFAAITLLCSFSIAEACLCDGEDTVKEAFTGASTVFMGRYLGSEYRKGIRSEMMDLHVSAQGTKPEYEILVYRFKVLGRWKGDIGTEVVLISDHARLPDGTEVISDCGLGFTVGREYLVYAYGGKNELASGACSRTRRKARAAKDIAELDRLVLLSKRKRFGR